MKLIGHKTFPKMAPGAKRTFGFSVAKYLAKKTGVTVSSVTWSSYPAGLSFQNQTDTTTQSTVRVVAPSNQRGEYQIRAKFVFSDSDEDTLCAPVVVDWCD